MAAAGVEPNIRILDADAKTAVAAAAQLGCEVGAIANSLVFDCDGEPLLVMASGAHRVDTELLARMLAPRRSARPLRSWCETPPTRSLAVWRRPGTRTGSAPLSTKPWPGIRSIWTAAGTADSVMSMTYEQLLVVTDGVAMAVR